MTDKNPLESSGATWNRAFYIWIGPNQIGVRPMKTSNSRSTLKIFCLLTACYLSLGAALLGSLSGKVVKVADGDTITVIKDLKVKGSSSVVKVGTKVRNIRLVEGDHNIDCWIEGFGAMKLKSEFVRKV